MNLQDAEDNGIHLPINLIKPTPDTLTSEVYFGLVDFSTSIQDLSMQN